MRELLVAQQRLDDRVVDARAASTRRMSGTSSPARRSAASRSGRESGLRPGAPKVRRTSADQLLQQARAGRRAAVAARAGRSAARSWTSTRHGTPAYVISAATSAPADSAATSSPSRADSGDAATAASWRASSTSARRCSAASSALKSVGSVGVARPEPVPVVRLLAVEQPAVDRRRAAQQAVAQPQVVAALDPHAGGEQRGIPARGVVPDPARRRRPPRARRRTPAGR